MSQPFIGEIRMFGGNFAPQGWAFCQGQQLAIAQNDTLYTLIGTTYGGDGQETFNLPDLQGRIPIHAGNGFILGQQGGSEEVTLTVNQMPAHTHVAVAQSGTGTQAGPGNGVWARSNLGQFASFAPNDQMAPNVIPMAGGSQPHSNMMPYLVVSFIISLFGVFPSQG